MSVLHDNIKKVFKLFNEQTTEIAALTARVAELEECWIKEQHEHQLLQEKYGELEDDYELQCQCRDAYRAERDEVIKRTARRCQEIIKEVFPYLPEQRVQSDAIEKIAREFNLRD